MESSRSSGTWWALGALKTCKEKFNSNALERGNTLTEFPVFQQILQCRVQMVLGEGRGESWAVFAEGRECGTVGAGCLVSLADIAVLSAAPALSPLPVFPPCFFRFSPVKFLGNLFTS